MVYLLNEEIGFPDPREGDEDGLFAVGGDLSEERLRLAYSYGIFPWYAFRSEDTSPSLLDPQTGKPYIQWWCPMKRFVIFPKEIHISHSMRQELKKLQTGQLRVTINQAFEQVIEQCGALRESVEGAWLGEDIKIAYTNLYHQGIASSVEVWEYSNENSDYNLVGGLYGVTLGKGFYGESMFSLRPSASKVALIQLALLLEKLGVKLIDCQFETPHLKSMGGRYITYDEYLNLIRS